MKPRPSPLLLIFLFLLPLLTHAGPVKVIFDTDMGSDCDDVGALALLLDYASEGKVEVLGSIFSSGKVPYGAAIIEAIHIYYGMEAIPVGASHDMEFGDPVDKMSAEKLAQDTAAFGHSIIHNTDATEQTVLNRQILASQPDSSVVYVTVGHTKGLYDLLVSEPDETSELSGKALIQSKVKRWVALGALRARNPEGYLSKDWNFFFNDTATYTEYLIEQLPVPMFFISAGNEVMTGISLKSTPPGNIVRTAYRDWLWWHEQRTLDDQRPSWDLAAVYYAVIGEGRFLTTISEGRMEFDAEAGCRWVAEENNPLHFFVEEKPGIQEAFAGYLNARIGKVPNRLN